MDKVSQKLVRNLKSRRYEVMDGINTPQRVETLQIGRYSPDSYGDNRDSNYNTPHESQSLDGSGRAKREHHSDIEMTAAVSGVVPDGKYVPNLVYKLMFWIKVLIEIVYGFALFLRYFHRISSNQCTWFWKVSSDAVLVHWSLLDGG